MTIVKLYRSLYEYTFLLSNVEISNAAQKYTIRSQKTCISLSKSRQFRVEVNKCTGSRNCSSLKRLHKTWNPKGVAS